MANHQDRRRQKFAAALEAHRKGTGLVYPKQVSQPLSASELKLRKRIAEEARPVFVKKLEN